MTSMSCEGEINETLVVTLQSSTNDDMRPRRTAKERLRPSVLQELWSIWRADPRVPSVKSRRLWAISRDANPRLVGSWFIRRRTHAKKVGQPIPDEPYDLALDPPGPISPKREQSATPINFEPETFSDPPSDDTLVYPLGNGNMDYNVETSSDTVFDEDVFVEPEKTDIPAYKEAPEQFASGSYRSQSKSSSANLSVAEDCYVDGVSLQHSPSSLCNVGQGNFTCILCTMKAAEDEVLPVSAAIPDASKNAFVPCTQLDFSPDTLSELSAIPFLFRTPRAVLPDHTTVEHQNVDNWAIIEDELGRLVSDGKLDFSFLDVPLLASMELLD